MSYPKARVEDADEDLDDLDDVLDQFEPAPATSSTSAAAAAAAAAPQSSHASHTPRAAGPAAPPNPLADPFGEFGEEFSRELAKAMESVMRELGDMKLAEEEGSNRPAAETEASKEERERAARAAIEALLVEGMNGAPDESGLTGVGGDSSSSQGRPPAGGPNPSVSSPPGEKPDFQQSIRAAMDRLKESESSLRDRTGSAAEPDIESLQALLSQMGDLGDLGGESDEDFAGILENMVGQLMSKDILYEPLKEMAEKFPPYLQEKGPTLSAADKTQYETQLKYVRQILAVFDEPGYSDENPEAQAKVVNLMNEMQAHGSPPEEVVGPMPPGFSLGPDGQPQIPEGCVIT